MRDFDKKFLLWGIAVYAIYIYGYRSLVYLPAPGWELGMIDPDHLRIFEKE